MIKGWFKLLLLFFFFTSNHMIVYGSEEKSIESVLYILIKSMDDEDTNPGLISIRNPTESSQVINRGITLPNYVPNSLIISPLGPYVSFLKYGSVFESEIEGHILGGSTKSSLQVLNTTMNKIIEITPGIPGEGSHYAWHLTQPAIYYISREYQKAGVDLFDVQSNNIQRLFISQDDTLEINWYNDDYNDVGMRFVRALPSGRGFSYINDSNTVGQRILTIVDTEGKKNQVSGIPPVMASFQWLPDESRFIYEDSLHRLWIFNIENLTKYILYDNGYNHVSINPVISSMALDLNGRIYIWSDSNPNWNRLNTQVDIHFPTWSPDGQYLAYFSDRDGYNQLFISDIHGHQHATISDIVGDIIEIHWGAFSNFEK